MIATDGSDIELASDEAWCGRLDRWINATQPPINWISARRRVGQSPGVTRPSFGPLLFVVVLLTFRAWSRHHTAGGRRSFRAAGLPVARSLVPLSSHKK